MDLCQDIQEFLVTFFMCCCCCEEDNTIVLNTTNSPINPEHFEPHHVYKSKLTF